MEACFWLFVLITAFTISYLTVPILVRWFSGRRGSTTSPERKVHSHRPRCSGVAIYLAFTLTLLANGILSPPVKAVLIAGSSCSSSESQTTCGAFLGREILLQIVLLSSCPSAGSASTCSRIDLWHAAVILTVIWIVGITNIQLHGWDGRPRRVSPPSPVFLA
jgi:UDP-N-acetylmuramyl pentapeptide phosphotransferase/UDP-N-acetylglucosamine-1-phosphate transferase